MRFSIPILAAKQCQSYYSYYPDVERGLSPKLFYYELATKVEDSKKRDHYEKMAVANKWTISDLQKESVKMSRHAGKTKKQATDSIARRKNIWSFDTSDPRFGKPAAKGRLPGQIVANALFYYTQPGWTICGPHGRQRKLRGDVD